MHLPNTIAQNNKSLNNKKNNNSLQENLNKILEFPLGNGKYSWTEYAYVYLSSGYHGKLLIRNRLHASLTRLVFS